ncbi:hypothetical protein M569_00802 [Genlisea aurea]|uniref:Uncharacterized protein n=1 Tax=Genlisea aurea TaxID=192259 RepID=S8D2L7_9LAMI|nr:hypothetical protein M569_00802 [Genlisea aurea]
MHRDFNENSFRIRHDDHRFLGRLFSKDKSTSSFRIYSGGVVAGEADGIPFDWETRPGTPKHPSAVDASVRPLTPPPAFYSRNYLPKKSRSKSKLLLHSILRRVSPEKSHVGSSAVSSSSSMRSISMSSSSRSSFSDQASRKWRRFSCFGSYSEETAAVDEMFPSARICFVGEEGDKSSGRRGLDGGWPIVIVKKALFRRGSAA